MTTEFACPHCGFLPENTWLSWRDNAEREIPWTPAMTKLAEGPRFVEAESTAFQCQRPACERELIMLEVSVPWSDVTGETEWIMTTPAALVG